MYTGHCRTLAIESNGFLIGLTDQGKTWINDTYQFVVLLKIILHEKRI